MNVERYVVRELIGRGGMASVYRVTHRVLGSDYAFKVLEFTSADMRERVIQEGRIQARLGHPNILAVHDAFELDGNPVLVLEYVRGPSLEKWLAQNEPPLEEALRLFRGIVRAIRFAHLQGVTHRDLKPANVLLAPTRDGLMPKVGDFGLAKVHEELGGQGITRTGTVMGTPEYQAPEQIRDASKVDHRADMFSLGAVLYELACHRRAFAGSDVVEIYKAVTSGTYAHPDSLGLGLPPPLVACIVKLLQVDAAARFTTCQEILQYLDSVHPGAAPIVDPEPVLSRRSKVQPPARAVGRELFNVGALPEAGVAAAPTIWDEAPSIALVIVVVAAIVTAMGGLLLLFF
jgi:serine/threonine protein kinase